MGAGLFRVIDPSDSGAPAQVAMLVFKSECIPHPSTEFEVEGDVIASNKFIVANPLTTDISLKGHAGRFRKEVPKDFYEIGFSTVVFLALEIVFENRCHRFSSD